MSHLQNSICVFARLVYDLMLGTLMRKPTAFVRAIRPSKRNSNEAVLLDRSNCCAMTLMNHRFGLPVISNGYARFHMCIVPSAIQLMHSLLITCLRNLAKSEGNEGRNIFLVFVNEQFLRGKLNLHRARSVHSSNRRLINLLETIQLR